VLVWLVSVILTSPVIFTKVSAARRSVFAVTPIVDAFHSQPTVVTNWAHLLNSECKGQSLSYKCKIAYKTEAPRLSFTFARQLPISVRVNTQGRRSTTKVMRHRVCSLLAEVHCVLSLV
jgi:hypothetical protein